MEYRFKNRYFKVDAQVAGEVCEKLEKEGKLTAKNLVDVSREENAPLHDEFEWDDAVAGELYREEQARNIIRHLEVVMVNNQEPVRAYFTLSRVEPEYKSIDAILKSEDDTEALLKMAYQELRAFQKKYGKLERLKGVFRAIDEIELSA